MGLGYKKTGLNFTPDAPCHFAAVAVKRAKMPEVTYSHLPGTDNSIPDIGRL